MQLFFNVRILTTFARIGAVLRISYLIIHTSHMPHIRPVFFLPSLFVNLTKYLIP